MWLVVLLIIVASLRLRAWLRRRPVIAFLHPYCASGGGGERVLWVGVAAVHAALGSRARLVIYTGDVGVSAAAMRNKAESRFGVRVPADIELCYVRSRRLVEPALYPIATLVGQSVGSMLLAVECLVRLPPRVFVDTTGFAFTYPVARFLGGCSVAAYVHYPTISTDMIKSVSDRVAAFNNRSLWTRGWARFAKLAYYRCFAAAYGAAGRSATSVMTNSTWTNGHISSLWACSSAVVFPPCDTERLCSDVRPKNDRLVVVSLAQFRPEKNHKLQLDAWARLPPDVRDKATLVVAGAARNEADETLLERLRDDCAALGLDSSVRFVVGAPRADIVALMADASIGLHTMRLEHFGIAVVEMMAAGLVPVAHASGGPLLDIVGDQGDRGFVADTADDYARCLAILINDSRRRRAMAQVATGFVRDRFSDAAFSTAFVAALAPTFASCGLSAS